MFIRHSPYATLQLLKHFYKNQSQSVRLLYVEKQLKEEREEENIISRKTVMQFIEKSFSEEEEKKVAIEVGKNVH